MHVLVLLKRCKEAGSQGKNCRKMVVGKTNEPLEILHQTIDFVVLVYLVVGSSVVRPVIVSRYSI